MEEKLRQKLYHFRDIVYLFVNTSLFLVENNLIPDDYIDRTLAPDAVSRCYDQVLLGGVLFDCPDNTVCEIVTPFQIRFCAMKLEKGDGYGVMGPFLADQEEESPSLDDLLLQNGVPISERDGYRLYLDRLPVVSQAKLIALMGGLANYLYGKSPQLKPHIIRLTPQNPAPCPVFEEDAMQARADAIRQRYEREARFMEAVARGDDNALHIQGRFALDRLPNRLRNQKNLLTVLNTLLRKATEQAKVHPPVHRRHQRQMGGVHRERPKRRPTGKLPRPDDPGVLRPRPQTFPGAFLPQRPGRHRLHPLQLFPARAVAEMDRKSHQHQRLPPLPSV